MSIQLPTLEWVMHGQIDADNYLALDRYAVEMERTVTALLADLVYLGEQHLSKDEVDRIAASRAELKEIKDRREHIALWRQGFERERDRQRRAEIAKKESDEREKARREELSREIAQLETEELAEKLEAAKKRAPKAKKTSE